MDPNATLTAHLAPKESNMQTYRRTTIAPIWTTSVQLVEADSEMEATERFDRGEGHEVAFELGEYVDGYDYDETIALDNGESAHLIPQVSP